MTEKETASEILEDEGTDTVSRIYEIGYLLVPTLSSEEILPEVDVLKQVIEKHGGRFISEGHPKLQALSYEMVLPTEAKRDKYNQAYFGWVKFEIDSAELPSVKRGIESLPSLVRFLLINTVSEDTMPVSRHLSSRRAPVSSTSPEEGESVAKEKGKGEEISEEEIDKSIEELVIE